MDLVAQRRLINGTAATLLAAAAGGVFWSLGPLDSKRTDPTNAAAGRTPDRVAKAEQPQGDDRGSDVDLRLALQKPLYEPPPPPPRPVKPVAKPVTVPRSIKPKKPKLDWSLAGTIIEAKRSVAILTDATGKTDVREAGEVVDLDPPGVLVRKIDSDTVTLEIDGDRTTLQLDRKRRAGGGAKNGRPDRGSRGPNR